MVLGSQMNSPGLRTEGFSLAVGMISLASCVSVSLRASGAQYVEILAELELTARSGYHTNSAEPRPQVYPIRCVTGTDAWRLEVDSGIRREGGITMEQMFTAAFG